MEVREDEKIIMTREIQPLNGNIVVESYDLNDDNNQKDIKPMRGILIPQSVNKQETLKAGKVIKVYDLFKILFCEPNDIVLYPKGSGYEISLDGRIYTVINIQNIVGKVADNKE